MLFWNRKIKPEEKAVLITGCDSGFGNRLAFRLNENGFKVYATVLDSNNSGSQELRAKCKVKENMIVLEMDVTNEKQIDECYVKVIEDLHRCHYQLWAIVNNAGYCSYGHTEWGTIDEYKKLFDVNVFGVVRVTRKFMPLIRMSKGRIVITASLSGRITLDNLGPHCMTQYALISYSEALRREMHKFKVEVSTIEPGIFKTTMYRTIFDSLERNWLQTSENVKQIYGDNYYAEQIDQLKTLKKLGMGSRDLDIVVNDMIDAVASKSPNRRYKPCNTIIFCLGSKFLPLYPQYIVDRAFYFLDNTKPISMGK